jgi:hypothetical protein
MTKAQRDRITAQRVRARILGEGPCFFIGDIIRLIIPGYSFSNRRAVIIQVRPRQEPPRNWHNISLRFIRKSRNLHDCGGACPRGRGWFVSEWEIELVKGVEHRR